MARWRPLDTQEAAVATARLEDAWQKILVRRPNIQADITGGTVANANVVRVLCDMVLRVLKNPDGFSQEKIDDWSGQRADSLADGSLFITDEELADITPGRSRRRSVRLVKDGQFTPWGP